MALILKNAHVVDPSVELDGVVDVLIEGDKIARVAENIEVEGAEVRDLSGKYLVPGLVDMHVHFRDPGFEYKETIETGSAAAVHGGFTDVATMPNPDPLTDTGAIDRVKPGLLDRDLLLMPDMASQPDPILSRGRYPHHNCYWIASDVWDLRVLGGLLMSDTTRRFVDALGVKMRGGTLRFQAQYLRLVHVPRYEQLDDAVREGLARSFETGNRDTAPRFAEAAYEGALQ